MEDATTNHKVAFDGRLEYYKHLRQYWDGLQNSTSMDDEIMKWKYLRGYYSRTHAWINGNLKTEILNLFNIIAKNINMLNNNAMKIDKEPLLNNVVVKLQDIEDRLFLATKHMLLPSKEDEEDTFDIDKWIDETDS